MVNAGRVVVFCAEFVIWIATIVVGARLGGACIGFLGAVGVGILVYGFQEPVGQIPFDVLQILMAVICATASLQVVGGMDVLIRWCEGALRRHPGAITLMAPAITYAMTVVSGTGYVFLTLLPIIAEVSRSSGVRPSRPLAVSMLASMYAVIASPISASVVFMTEMFVTFERDVSYSQLLLTMFPSTLIGLIVTSLCSLKLGSDTDWRDPLDTKENDIEAQTPSAKANPSSHCLADNAVSFRSQIEPSLMSVTTVTKPKRKGEVAAVFIFFGCILLAITVSVIASYVELQAGPGDGIVISMLSGAALIIAMSDAAASEIPKCSVFANGMTAAICILGVAWMGGTFMGAHMEGINYVTGDILTSQPWVFMILVWLFASLLFGQAVTARAMFPPAMQLGLSSYAAVCAFPCTATLWLLSTAPAIIAGAQMDSTGSFRLGKYVVDHSCAIPGFIWSFTTIGATAAIALLVVGRD